MHQAGIPRQMAITLYKPFVLRELLKDPEVERRNVNSKYESMDDDVWQALEEVVREHPVLLNRAPTLHRLGIQAFELKLIDGKAIRTTSACYPSFLTQTLMGTKWLFIYLYHLEAIVDLEY